MIEHDIDEYLSWSLPNGFEEVIDLLHQAREEIERIRQSETAISQLESLKYYDSWIKLADSWIESPETDFKAFLNNFMEANDPEKHAQILY